MSAGLPAFAADIVSDWGRIASSSGDQSSNEGSLEEEAASGMARSLEWTLQYSVEVLSGTRAAAEYIQVRQYSSG